MAVELLAATVVTSFLRPYLEKGAKRIAEEVTGKVSEAAADHVTGVAENIWNRVKGAFTAPTERNVVELFKDDPEAMQPMMEKTLSKKLEEDSALAQDLEKLVNKPSPDGSGTGAQIIGATYAGIVDLRGGTVSGSGATITGLSVGGSPPPLTAPTTGEPPRQTS